MKKETAKAIYRQVPDWMKVVLHDEFGEKTFTKDFTDIKTIEDARIATGYTEGSTQKAYEESLDEWAYRMLKMVTRAINGEWTPDWSNTDQPKWYNYFRVLPSGSGFSDSCTDHSYGVTSVCSRLCFETQQKAQFAAKQFEDLYIKYLLITK